MDNGTYKDSWLGYSGINYKDKKLSNERFVNSAPEAVVATERAKQADAEAKIKVLEEQIAGLK